MSLVWEAISPRSAQRTSASMMVHDPATALAVIAETDMVTLVPRRFAKACASSAQIRIFDFPQDHAEMIELSMLWHSRVHDDPGSLWLRALIREAVNLSSVWLAAAGIHEQDERFCERRKERQKGAGSHWKLSSQPGSGKLGSLLSSSKEPAT